MARRYRIGQTGQAAIAVLFAMIAGIHSFWRAHAGIAWRNEL